MGLPVTSRPWVRSTGLQNAIGTRCSVAAVGKAFSEWPVFHRLKQGYPLQRPKLVLPYRAFQRYAR